MPRPWLYSTCSVRKIRPAALLLDRANRNDIQYFRFKYSVKLVFRGIIMEQPVKIRRFVAIGLVALTILFLFWPSIINLNAKSDAWENATDRMKLLGRSGFADEFARDYVLYRNNSYHSYTDSEVSESEYRDAVNAGRECYDVFMKDGKLSFLKVCTFTPKMLKYAHIDEAAPIIAGMLLWMMFAMLLLFAIAAILMMLFNKSKAFNVLLVVF